MAACVEEEALVHPPIELGLRNRPAREPSDMDRHRRGLEPNAPALLAQPLEEVRVLGIEEVSIVESSDRFECRTPHENERTEQRLDVPRPVMADPGGVVALEERKPG